MHDIARVPSLSLSLSLARYTLRQTCHEQAETVRIHSYLSLARSLWWTTTATATTPPTPDTGHRERTRLFRQYIRVDLPPTPPRAAVTTDGIVQ